MKINSLQKTNNYSANNSIGFTSIEEYKDPLNNYPLKLMTHSTDVAAIVDGFSPKLGAALRVPAFMYYGADIYDKYKNDNTTYAPSRQRGARQAILQAFSNVLMPTLAATIGQATISQADRITKNGLTTSAKEEVMKRSLAYMETKHLHQFADKKDEYIEGFKSAILIKTKDSKDDFKTLTRKEKLMRIFTPIKKITPLTFQNEEKLAAYATKKAEDVLLMREELLQNKRPQNLSKKLFKKFQELQVEYKNIYPKEEYMSKAAKNILREYHNSEILKNKMVKTVGGLIAVLALTKPIEKLADIVIKKGVDPALDVVSGYKIPKKEVPKEE